MVFDDKCFGLEPVLIKGGGYDFFEGYKGPELQGVYGCICSGNGRFYIGSSKNFKMRLNSHETAIKGGYHDNPLLTGCWNKYGEDSLSWYWLENVVGGKKELFFVEQLYLDFFQPWPENGGMNLARFARGGTRGNLTYEEKEERAKRINPSMSPYRIQSPTGEIHEFYSISGFSDKMGALKTGISGVISGVKKQSNGWSLPYEILQLRSPNGELVDFTSVRHAAEVIGCSDTRAGGLIFGDHKSINNWTLPSKPATSYSIQSPQGEVFTFFSILQFRKDHGLPHSLRKVLAGETPHCVGWTLPGVVLPPKRVVTVISPEGVEMEVENVAQFARKHSINGSGLNGVILGRYKQANGFTLKQD